jgi:hypothetical protein
LFVKEYKKEPVDSLKQCLNHLLKRIYVFFLFRIQSVFFFLIRFQFQRINVFFYLYKEKRGDYKEGNESKKKASTHKYSSGWVNPFYDSSVNSSKMVPDLNSSSTISHSEISHLIFILLSFHQSI